MDFSDLLSSIKEVEQQQGQPDSPEQAPAISAPKQINLNPAELLSEIQKKKKENELSHRAKQRKSKKIEKAKGYYEKLQQKDRQNDKQKKHKRGALQRSNH